MDGKIDNICGQTFTREDTKIIKGVAVVLMLLHHLWGFPDRLPNNMQLRCFEVIFYNTDFMYALGAFGKICVSLFMFLGGYGLWKKTRNSYSLASDIIRLYGALWKVAVVFIPIGLLFFSNQPNYADNTAFCHVFDNASLKNIVFNFLGLSSSYNREWWFFETYLGALVVGYIFIFVNKIDNFYLDVFIVALIEIITQKIFPVLFSSVNYNVLRNDLFFNLLISFNPCVCVFLMGIVFAKYDALVRLRTRYMQALKSELSRFVVSVIGLVSIFMCRQCGFGADYDMIYVPFLTVFLLELFHILKPLGAVFGLLGNHSTNMWLIHSFYCYYFYFAARIVCQSQDPFVSLLTLVAMSFVSSVVLNRIVMIVRYICKVIFNRKLRSE